MKPDITVALVRRLVAEQFPAWAALEIRSVPRQGHDNRTFRLGDNLVVRLPSDDGYVAGVNRETRTLALLDGRLGVDLPTVVALGRPGSGYPFPWSVRRWLPGDVPSDAGDIAYGELADDLGDFLRRLRELPAEDGPPCGRDSFFRGCHPSVYSDDVAVALRGLGDAVAQDACRGIWHDALVTAWSHDPVWFHGDLAEDNLLLRDGRLGAVIDFGICGVGDPACDLTIGWTLLADVRPRFRAAVDLDEGTWARARGWALWKALISVDDPDTAAPERHRRTLMALGVWR